MDEAGPFSFPPDMPREAAQAILAQAYRELDAGKLLRRALKLQREAGWDPPHDVQYVAEPVLHEFEDGVGVSLNADILIHEVFEGLKECLGIFEQVLGEALIERVEKKVARWERSGRP